MMMDAMRIKNGRPPRTDALKEKLRARTGGGGSTGGFGVGGDGFGTDLTRSAFERLSGDLVKRGGSRTLGAFGAGR